MHSNNGQYDQPGEAFLYEGWIFQSRITKVGNINLTKKLVESGNSIADKWQPKYMRLQGSGSSTQSATP